VLGEYQPDGTPAFVVQPDTSASESFNAFSPKLGITYHISDDNQLYAIYSRGYRAGGFTQLSSDPSQPPLYSYKPEYSSNYEVGIKNDFLEKRLRLNVAAFYTIVNDAQVPTLILPDAVTIIRNAGKLTSKGGDLEVLATPIKGLELQYSLGVNDAKYETLKLSQNGEEVNLDGNKQIFTPNATSMLMAQFTCNLDRKEKYKLIVRGEWFYLGKQYFDLANTISQDAYSLLNTRVGVSTRHVDLFLWGRNLGDTKYIAYAYDFGGVHLGNPQTYGATLLLKL
jgi:iron complex outermembrane receptor protein